MKNKNLLEIEKKSKYFVWIYDQAGFNEDGLHFSNYHESPSGSLILRSDMDSSEKYSIPWLTREMGLEKRILYYSVHEDT